MIPAPLRSNHGWRVNLALRDRARFQSRLRGSRFFSGLPSSTWADFIGTALARRPELAVLSARCAQADVTLDLRKKERYHWFSLAQVSREFGGPGAPNAWGLRVGIDLPIFKWTRELMRGPEAEVEHCRAEVQAERSRISLEVEDLVEQLRAQSGELEYQHQAI